MSRSMVYGPALLLVALLTGMGCYTMLRHPAADGSEEGSSAERTHQSDVGDQACSDCHVEPSSYHWSEQYYRTFYGYYPSAWTNYYARPWWRSDSHPSAGSADTDRTPLLSPDRHAWDRGPTSPFIPRISGPSNTPAVTTPEPKPSTKPTTTAPDTTSKPKNDRPAEPSRERHAWGR
jgi:hypothetical protein